MEISMMIGAIVSADVASKAKPILMAERSDPLDEADSGWQFWGGDSDPLEPEHAQIWAVGEVLEYEPTLAAYIGMPSGTRLERSSQTESWQNLEAR